MIKNMKGGNMINNKINSKILYTILVLGVLVVGWYILDSNSPIVSAQGSASMKVQPDQASVYVSIEAHNTTAQAAQTTNNLIRDSVVAALLKSGVPNSSIQFQQYSIYPEYNWDNGRQTQKGFVATQTLVVNSSDFSTIPGMVDSIVASGGLVSSIQFELSQQKQNYYKAQALESAGKDAETKASATAGGLGKSIGRLVSVQTQDFNYPGPILYYARADSASGVTNSAEIASVKQAASNISPQDIEVSANIQVEYKLNWF